MAYAIVAQPCASIRRVERHFCCGLNRLPSVLQAASTRGARMGKPKLQVPRRKLGPRRHGQRDREAPRGPQHRRRAGRQAPQGVDLELPFELRREGRGHDEVDDP